MVKPSHVVFKGCINGKVAVRTSAINLLFYHPKGGEGKKPATLHVRLSDGQYVEVNGTDYTEESFDELARAVFQGISDE